MYSTLHTFWSSFLMGLVLSWDTFTYTTWSPIFSLLTSFFCKVSWIHVQNILYSAKYIYMYVHVHIGHCSRGGFTRLALGHTSMYVYNYTCTYYVLVCVLKQLCRVLYSQSQVWFLLLLLLHSKTHPPLPTSWEFWIESLPVKGYTIRVPVCTKHVHVCMLNILYVHVHM